MEVGRRGESERERGREGGREREIERLARDLSEP